MKVDDVIVTSGLGGGYFRGLIVGTVVRVEDSNGQAIRKIVVAPNDNVSGLEEVMVVTSVSAKKNAADAEPQPAAQTADSATSRSAESGEEADEVPAEEATQAQESEELSEDELEETETANGEEG